MENQSVVISSFGHYLPEFAEQWLHEGAAWPPEARSSHLIEQERVDNDLQKYMKYDDMRRFDKLTKFAMCAALRCMSDSGLSVSGENKNNIGCVFNTIYGPLSVFMDFIHSGLTSPLGLSGASALLFPYTVMNASSGVITMRFQVNGFNTTLTGYNPVCYAYDIIKDQKAKALLTGGFDELTDDLIKAHSPDITHLIEGSAMILLEDYEHAKKRKADIHFFMEGYGIGTSLVKNTQAIDNYGDINEDTLYRVINNVFSKTSIDPCQTGLILSLSNHPHQKDTEFHVLQRIWDHIPHILYPKEIIGEAFGVNELIVYELLDVYLSKNAHAVNSETPYILINHYQVGGNITSIIVKK